MDQQPSPNVQPEEQPNYQPQKPLNKTGQIAAIVVAGILVIGGISYGSYYWWQKSANNQIVGNDRDAHGCIGSAGYSWCQAKQKCLRVWEESCASPSATPDPTANWQTYKNEQYGFEVRYPNIYSPTTGPQLNQFQKSEGANYLVYLKHSSAEVSISAVITNIAFDLQTIKQRFAPTGAESAPSKVTAGNNNFYFYGAGGGGVAYSDVYFYNLNGKLAVIYFNGPYVNDKTPSQGTKTLEPQILATFKFMK